VVKVTVLYLSVKVKHCKFKTLLFPRRGSIYNLIFRSTIAKRPMDRGQGSLQGDPCWLRCHNPNNLIDFQFETGYSLAITKKHDNLHCCPKIHFYDKVITLRVQETSDLGQVTVSLLGMEIKHCKFKILLFPRIGSLII
jgi:hypothetical protein